MRLMSWLAALTATLVAAAPAHAEPYDLRGFRLGMSLEEFRASPFPDPDMYEGLHVLCTGDEGAKDRLELKVFDAVAQAGIIRCNHFKTYRGSGTYTRVEEATLNVAGVQVFQIYEFVPDPKSGQHRLFRIAIRSNTQFWDQFWQAYTSKFGKPTRLDKGKVQNKLGGTFEKVTAMWANKESSITLEQRTTAVDLMAITYLHNALGANVVKQMDAVEGKPSSKL